MLDDDAASALAARFGRFLALLARAQLAKALKAMAEGAAPRDAISEAQVGFSGRFAEQLAEALSELLQRVVGIAEVRALPVGALKLSRRLYLHDAETTAEALSVIRAHAVGVHQARELALRLYDGYSPRDGIRRPLEGRARAELPKALRRLTDEPRTRQTLQRVFDAGQAQAARLKTAALRAAYLQTFEAWRDGAGRVALQRMLEVAVIEKNRYVADRIAQTELARAHQAGRALEVMEDDQLEVVEVRINPNHPREDICDLHARADLWGLGPGRYPKAVAPRPPFHPYCWCRIRPIFSQSAIGAREVRGGAAAYLRTLSESEAGRVMGSRERASAVLAGYSAEAVINAGQDPAYRLRRVGDIVQDEARRAA